MNAIYVVLSVVVIAAITYVVFKTQQKISVLKNRNELYAEFIRKTSVKKFLEILNRMDGKTIDDDISFMLEKYFDFVLMRVEHEVIPRLLGDINKSRHPEILRKALVKAATKEGIMLFGLALAECIHQSEDKLIIESFLGQLPELERRGQYIIALSVLQQAYTDTIIDFPAEFRRPIEDDMKDLQKKITQLL